MKEVFKKTIIVCMKRLIKVSRKLIITIKNKKIQN